MCENEAIPIVIDNGTGYIKAGYAGDDLPKVVLPTVLGVPLAEGTLDKQCYIGEEALRRSDALNLRHPIEHGIIKNWEDIEKIWQHVFHEELGTDPEHHPVLLTDSPLNPKKNREKMAEIMFETHKTPAMHIAVQAVLSMYASGRTTGIVLESGAGLSHVVPIYSGYAIHEGVQRADFGGKDLTKYLACILGERDYAFTNNDHEVLRKMKENFCYVSFDFDEETAKAAEGSSLEKTYELPDGKEITVNSERFRCPEALFQPSLLDQRSKGVDEMIHASIMKCDVDIRKELFGNVLLSGGNTLFAGFEDRVRKGLTRLAPATMKIKIIAGQERRFSVWMGGSVVSSLHSFKPMWVSKQEYEENGPTIVHKKCF